MPSAVGIIAAIIGFFAAYRTHVHAVCGLVYDWLYSPEGRPTLSLMERTLEGCCDIDHCSHGELQAMITF